MSKRKKSPREIAEIRANWKYIVDSKGWGHWFAVKRDLEAMESNEKFFISEDVKKQHRKYGRKYRHMWE